MPPLPSAADAAASVRSDAGQRAERAPVADRELPRPVAHDASGVALADVAEVADDAAPSTTSSDTTTGPRGGIARRRALTAERAAPREHAHLELPVIRLLPPASRADAARPLSVVVAELLQDEALDERLADDPSREDLLVARARELAQRAYPADRITDRGTDAWVDHAARHELHRTLLACYQPHVRLPHHGMAANQFHPLAVRLLAALERPWERDLLARARRNAQRIGSDLSAEALPSDPDAFCEWFKTTAFTHPLYEHPLYGFLAGEADRAELERFLRWEAAGEAAFDDLVALGQVGTRGEVKIEMGRNYWDELGNGKSHAVHTHLFHKLTETLQITAPEADELPWQVLSGVNVMLWSCIPRRNAFRAQGTLGAVELLAPQRCTRLVTGALRVGVPKKAMAYYSAHAIIDVGHAEGWLEHVVKPQIAERPEARIGIAEGLVARADASLDYFDWAMAELNRG